MELRAKKFYMSTGIGKADKTLPSFDKALLDAGVGNYNLVRLSSILPARCEEVDEIDLPEGCLLPTAYSTISSNHVGDKIVSTIGVGFPVDSSKVGVIMEYSAINKTERDCVSTLKKMIREAFDERGWELYGISFASVSQDVEQPVTYTTFACIAEW